MQDFYGAGWESLVHPEPDKESGMLPLGDILISIETAKKQALEYGNTDDYEIAYLIIHTTLHLLGYDHDCEENEKMMHEKNKLIIQETELI